VKKLQVKVQKLPESKVKLTVTVEKEEMQGYEKHAYRHLVSSVKIAGFRPGKAPLNILKKEVGQAKFDNEVLEVAIPQSYYKAVTDEKIQAISQPQVNVSKFIPGELLEYEAEVAILPEVKLPDYKNIKVKIEEDKVKKEEIDQILDNLRKERAILRDVEREAKNGDRVEIDFDGFIGSNPLQGGSSKNHPIVIGEGNFIPGFEEELIGLKQGDTKEFDIKFPDNYHVADIAGKGVHFIIKMHIIQEVDLPELNDKFVEQIGPFKKVADLKKDIEKNLEQAKKEESKRKAEQELLEKIVAKSKIEVPKDMVDQETQAMIVDLESAIIQKGGNFDDYLKSIGKKREDLDKELKGDAEKRVKTGLVLSQVSKEEGILVTDVEVEAEVDKRIVGMPNAKEFKEKYFTEENKKDIELQLFTRKTIERLLGYATK